MNWFRNLSIIQKLLLSFAVIGGMGGAIFVCGVVTIRAMARSNSALYEHAARSLDQVTNLSTAYQQVLVTLRDVARSADPEDMRQQVELRKAYSSLVTQSLDSLESSVSTQGAQKLIGEFRNNRAGLEAEIEEFEALALSGNRERAGELLDRGELKRLADTQVDLINRISTEVTAGAKQINDQAKAVTSSSFDLMVTFASLGTALEILLCSVMVWTIGGAVKELRRAAERLAVGDPNVQIAVHSRDELGALAESFRRVAALYEDRANVTQRIAAGDMDATVQVACTVASMSPAAMRWVTLARSSYRAATRRKDSASAPSSSREWTAICTLGSPTARRSAARRSSLTAPPMVHTMTEHSKISSAVPRLANVTIRSKLLEVTALAWSLICFAPAVTSVEMRLIKSTCVSAIRFSSPRSSSCSACSCCPDNTRSSKRTISAICETRLLRNSWINCRAACELTNDSNESRLCVTRLE